MADEIVYTDGEIDEVRSIPDFLPPPEHTHTSEPIHQSSGNVFADLGFDDGEVVILQTRAKLMADLRESVITSGLTQVQAAEKLGIAQSQLSDLMRRKWERFSLEMLITLEARAGRQVTLELVGTPILAA